MARRYRAVVIDGFGGPDRLRLGEVELRERGEDEIVVRVEHVAVNPVDVQTRAGLTISDARFPMVLGWDAMGVVEAGEGAGRRVALMTPQVVDQAGTYAERIVVAAQAAAPVPDALDGAAAAAVPLAGLTAAQGLRMLALTAGETLVVNGACGALGRFALQLAARAGVTVVAVSGAGDAELARRLGASAVVERATDLDASADAALDLVGGAAAQALLEAVRDGGRFVTAVPPARQLDGLREERRGIRARTVYVRADPALLSELLAGELIVPIAHRLPLEQAGRAHALVEAGGLRGKVVLDVAA